MGRDPEVYLWDAREAADALLGFLAGRSYEDYSRDLMVRSAVERQFDEAGFDSAQNEARTNGSSQGNDGFRYRSTLL